MKLPIIQSLWIGDPLSNLEKLCVQSFLDNGHEFHLYTYADVGDVPAGAIIKDGNEILPESEIWKTKRRASVAPFSDWFRYEMLYQNGGFWVDMDIVCLQPFNFDADFVFCGSSAGRVGNAVIKFPKGSKVMRAMADACKNKDADQPWDTPEVLKRKARRRAGKKPKEQYLELGPEMLTNVAHHFDIYKYAAPSTTFFPHASELSFLIFRRHIYAGAELSPHTYSVNLGNSILMSNGIDKNSRFPDDSLIEMLKRKHGINNLPNAPFVSGEQIGAARVAKRKARIKRERILFLSVALLIGIAIGYLLA